MQKKITAHSKRAVSQSSVKQTAAKLAGTRQQRAVVTRSALIEAARGIFARDGFEHARIEEIAERAGKSRGAFYANFRDKEEVFFAIFEEDMVRDHERIRPVMQQQESLEERMKTLVDYLVKYALDKQRVMLNIEFKQFAIRHPKLRAKLARLHRGIKSRFSLPEIEDLLPQTQSEAERRACSLVLGGVIEGMAVNRLFDPTYFDRAESRRYLELCVRMALKLPLTST